MRCRTMLAGGRPGPPHMAQQAVCRGTGTGTGGGGAGGVSTQASSAWTGEKIWTRKQGNEGLPPYTAIKNTPFLVYPNTRTHTHTHTRRPLAHLDLLQVLGEQHRLHAHGNKLRHALAQHQVQPDGELARRGRVGAEHREAAGKVEVS